MKLLGVLIKITATALLECSEAAKIDENNFPSTVLGDPVQGCPFADTVAHDEAVKTRINRHIEQVNRDWPEWSQEDRMLLAWSNNIKERESDPTNTVGRDADYYFAARKELAASSSTTVKVVKAAIGEVAYVVYADLKIGAEALGHPEWTRTDPDKPNAPVGGFGWMNEGIADGFGDDPESLAALSLYQE